MPNKAGRFSGMERDFVANMAKYNDQKLAAERAGYKQASLRGWQLMKNPLIVAAVRSEVTTFLNEKAGPAAVYNLAEIMLDAKMPAGARVKASEIIAKMAGLGHQEGESGKELHEMTGDELRREIQRMEATQAAMQRALSDQAQPVLDHVKDATESGVFD